LHSRQTGIAFSLLSRRHYIEKEFARHTPRTKLAWVEGKGGFLRHTPEHRIAREANIFEFALGPDRRSHDPSRARALL
jgi:hypothetical protein